MSLSFVCLLVGTYVICFFQNVFITLVTCDPILHGCYIEVLSTSVDVYVSELTRLRCSPWRMCPSCPNEAQPGMLLLLLWTGCDYDYYIKQNFWLMEILPIMVNKISPGSIIHYLCRLVPNREWYTCSRCSTMFKRPKYVCTTFAMFTSKDDRSIHTSITLNTMKKVIFIVQFFVIGRLTMLNSKLMLSTSLHLINSSP